MTRDDILRMAREVGGSQIMRAGKQEVMEFTVEPLERFAALIAAAERKEAELRCAKTPVLLGGHHEYTALKVQSMMMEAIRARGQK